MRTRVTDGQTDGRTDGAGYIGPAEGNGGSKKYNLKSEFLVRRSKHHAYRDQRNGTILSTY